MERVGFKLTQIAAKCHTLYYEVVPNIGCHSNICGVPHLTTNQFSFSYNKTFCRCGETWFLHINFTSVYMPHIIGDESEAVNAPRGHAYLFVKAQVLNCLGP